LFCYTRFAKIVDMTNQHTCRALAIHCIDFRFQKFLQDYLEGRFPHSYDRVAVAGGVKNLPLEQCEVSIRLHSPKTIALFQHEDCGAYGGSGQFTDSQAEQELQKQELQKAEQALKDKFPGIAVEKFFVSFSGEIIAS